MNSMSRMIVWFVVCILALPSSQVLAASADANGTSPGDKVNVARLDVFAAKRAAVPISKYMTGKFCEHLGNNIYNGMDSQILLNPTMAPVSFSTGQMSPDGIATFQSDEAQVARQIRGKAQRFGAAREDLDNLVRDYKDGLACFWGRVGGPSQVRVSPDTGPYGGRAQRVQVSSADEGIAQGVYLPLHRVREYEFELLARSSDVASLRISLAWTGEQAGHVDAVSGLSPTWTRLTGVLRVDNKVAAGAACKFSITAAAPGQFVVARAMLRPADHIRGADPDVIRFLRDSHLPILRWPGGNFVSGYHWRDGVGPADRRPTKPNYAWGDLETNQFGTDEFMAFCQAVGCEPMICINAGDGTPQEAADWVQYCNGAVTTPMGAMRAANGHPEPYQVRYWEVGNELWGRWQFHWTTAEGNVDRFTLFSQAMLQADPSIRLSACGAPVFWGKAWNDTLIAGAHSRMQVITDHPLIGGDVAPDKDPMDVYRDFMAVPEVLGQKWAALEKDMAAAGIKEPRLEVTELQMFAHIARRPDPNSPVRLTGENLVSPATLAEALYDVSIYHQAVRLSPFVEMITHSATVNHGGGLRKSHERVYANPCYYGQSMFARWAQATPVEVTLESPREQAALVLPELRNVTSSCSYATIDALAAVSPQGRLLVSLVHRGTDKPISVEITVHDFNAGATAEVQTLSASAPWAQNTLENPGAVKPVQSTAEIQDGVVHLDVRPFSLVHLSIPAAPVANVRKD
jgi:alpha-N-arabinofuranosidase